MPSTGLLFGTGCGEHSLVKLYDYLWVQSRLGSEVRFNVDKRKGICNLTISKGLLAL